MAQETKEERQVVFYSEDAAPTDPLSVTSETPVNEINLNWRESDLPEKLRTKHVHRLHPYLGKFIPQLVEIFLRKYFSQGQTVLDPFCGSGTTLVQANELGINSLGYDVSAFNVLLTKVKLTKYDVAKARAEIFDILRKTRLAIKPQSQNQLSLWKDPSFSKEFDETRYLSDWFAEQARKELLTYLHFINTGSYRYKDLLKIILSRSARSARLVTHYDLDFPKAPQTTSYWCYKHSRYCEPTKTAYKFLERYSIDTSYRIGEFEKVRTDATWKVAHADSRNATFPEIDGVITSPPYVGLIDYHKQHEYAYQLLGLVDKSEKEIGPASKGSSQIAKSQYQIMLAKVFTNVSKSIKPNGRVIVVAGDKYHLYDQIAKDSGFEREITLNRHVNRRTGRRQSNFYESVFVWRKLG
jgi:DNA modification methylase